MKRALKILLPILVLSIGIGVFAALRATKPVQVAAKIEERVWRVQVGRNPLFLLDTNIPENRPEDRELTSKLYSGDHDMRIRQEILLGIGGLSATVSGDCAASIEIGR